MKFTGTIGLALSALLFVACGDGSIESKAESAVNKMCACKDVKCFESAEKELKAVGQEIEKKQEKDLSKETLEKLGKLKDKAEKCKDEAAGKFAGGGKGEGSKGDSVADVAKKFSDIADNVCNCPDQECAMLAMSALAEVGEAAEKSGADVDELGKAANKHVERASECLGKLP